MKQVEIEICIQVFNRHLELRELLDQLNEIYLSNCNLSCLIGDYSTETLCSEIVAELSKSYTFTRYYKSINKGIDFGFSELVERSIGKYCWLMSDDDHLHFEQASTFLKQGLNEDYDIYILNADVWSQTFSIKLRDGMTVARENGEYEYIKTTISYVGSLVIKRDIWRANCSDRFFGTYFNHAYVLKNALNNFAKIRNVNQPVLKIRANNALWTTTSFQIWTQHWPRFLEYFNTGLYVERLSDFSMKNILYYYAYGSLNSKSIREIGPISVYDRLKFSSIFLTNRRILSFLILIYLIIKNRSLVGEPQYYLLRSINNRCSFHLLKRFFNE